MPATPALPDRAPALVAGDGVVLRSLRPSDAEGVVEQCRDPETARWTGVPVPYGPAEAGAFLRAAAAGWARGTRATFAVQVDGRFAGSTDLRLLDGSWAQVGYGLVAAARGRGVASCALRRLLRWGFDDLGLQGVHWSAVVGNGASRRVAERCGVVVEGTVRGQLVLRGTRHDGWVGSVLPDDLRRLDPAPSRASSSGVPEADRRS